MAMRFDADTIDRLRAMPPDEAFYAAKDVVYGRREVGSEDFLEACEQLVEQGILTWDQVDEFDTPLRE